MASTPVEDRPTLSQIAQQKKQCPNCEGNNLRPMKHEMTKGGERKTRYYCRSCGNVDLVLTEPIERKAKVVVIDDPPAKAAEPKKPARGRPPGGAKAAAAAAPPAASEATSDDVPDGLAVGDDDLSDS